MSNRVIFYVSGTSRRKAAITKPAALSLRRVLRAFWRDAVDSTSPVYVNFWRWRNIPPKHQFFLIERLKLSQSRSSCKVFIFLRPVRRRMLPAESSYVKAFSSRQKAFRAPNKLAQPVPAA